MILGIESSCDESSIAVFDPDRGVLVSLIHSQLDLHRKFGGVVPDLAVREHLERFPLLFEQARQVIDPDRISAVAVTHGPGLAGCLAVGIAAAKGCSLLWRCPLVGVNHLTAHAWSPFIRPHGENPERFSERLGDLLPHLGMIVSGGNTLIFRLDRDRSLHVLADTRDDAAGEALDKGAKLLGLPYPGGPEIEKRAVDGDPRSFDFPRAFPNPNDRAFSFSGVKTSLRYRLEKLTVAEVVNRTNDLCASYQEAVVEALIRKFWQVLKREDGIKSLGLSGGVANNSLLRNRFVESAQSVQMPSLIAEPEFTGDNAAMIAFTAFANPEGVSRDYDFLSFEPNLAVGL